MVSPLSFRRSLPFSFGITLQISPSQDPFHPDLLRGKPASLIEAQRRGVAAPHVQRQIVTAAVLRQLYRRFIQLPADVLAAQFFIHAKIVYIQSFDVGQNRIVHVLLINAKATALGPTWAPIIGPIMRISGS